MTAAHAQRRAALRDAHGVPARADTAWALRQLGRRGDVHPRDAVAFIYASQAAADAWAAANLEDYGHPPLGTCPADGGVLGVLDLRPSLAARGTGPTPPSLPDDWTPGPRGRLGRDR